MPQYDFEIHNRKEERILVVEPTDVIVLEGILALYDEEINAMMDLRLFVETDADVRILRRIRRDVIDRGRDWEGVIDQYLSTVKPMHEQFIEPSKKHADVIIPEGAQQRRGEPLRGEAPCRGRGRRRRSWERGSLEEELGEKRSLDMDDD